MTKEDVKFSELLTWDNYLGRSPSEALMEIYLHATKVSQSARNWYWESIKSKKICSLSVRGITFILVVLGAVLPILAGVSNETNERLILTQLGVTSLATAGLLQIADRIFGWSSGWLRYMTTALAMEDQTRKFELEWANYMINKTGDLTEDDKKPLFTLAKQLEDDISKMQSEETDKWVTEFNNSTALLGELIKSKRESADKSLAEEKEKEKTQVSGAVELKLIHQAEPVTVQITFDDKEEENFTGIIWSKLGISPGQHQVSITTLDENSTTMMLAVNVMAGGIEKLEVNLP